MELYFNILYGAVIATLVGIVFTSQIILLMVARDMWKQLRNK